MSANAASIRRACKTWLGPVLLLLVFAALVGFPGLLRDLLSLLFPGRSNLLYPRAGIGRLVEEHLTMCLASSLLALVVGLVCGVLATRSWAGSFTAIAETLAAGSQTLPPAAVLALCVPALGFGLAPTIVALFLYSLLPILRNTMSGIQSVDPEIVEAASGMGMGQLAILFKVELPLAAPVILAGLRTAVTVNVGTATIGATIGAGGLGAPIIAGLVAQQPSYLAEGAIIVALLALALDSIFAALQRGLPSARAAMETRA